MSKHSCLFSDWAIWLSSPSLISQTPLIFTAPLGAPLCSEWRPENCTEGCPVAGLLVSLFAVLSVYPNFSFTFWAVTLWVCPYFSLGGALNWHRPLLLPHFPFPGPDPKDTAIYLPLLQDPLCFWVQSKESSNVEQEVDFHHFLTVPQIEKKLTLPAAESPG